eukprot:COSAG04_NODE_346_length_16127_cov_10.497442_1_plen_52_part_10
MTASAARWSAAVESGSGLLRLERLVRAERKLTPAALCGAGGDAAVDSRGVST